jgi:hypothetical protein
MYFCQNRMNQCYIFTMNISKTSGWFRSVLRYELKLRFKAFEFVSQYWAAAPRLFKVMSFISKKIFVLIFIPVVAQKKIIVLILIPVIAAKKIFVSYTCYSPKKDFCSYTYSLPWTQKRFLYPFSYQNFWTFCSWKINFFNDFRSLPIPYLDPKKIFVLSIKIRHKYENQGIKDITGSLLY